MTSDRTDYHAHEALGSTDVKRLLDSQALFQFHKANPNLFAQTPAMRFGTAYHCFVLEPEVFAETYVVEKICNRSKADKETIATYAAQGKRVVTPEDFKKMILMKGNLEATLDRHGLFWERTEVPYITKDVLSETPIKALFDATNLSTPLPTFYDIKTISDLPTPENIIKAISNYGYHIQAGHYVNVLNHGERSLVERENLGIEFFFIFCQTSMPYATVAVRIPSDMIRAGARLAWKAYDSYEIMNRSNPEPISQDFIFDLHVPVWFEKQFEQL